MAPYNPCQSRTRPVQRPGNSTLILPPAVTRQGPLRSSPPEAIVWRDDDQASASPAQVRITADPSKARISIAASIVTPSGSGSVALSSADPNDPPTVSMNPASNADDMM